MIVRMKKMLKMLKYSIGIVVLVGILASQTMAAGNVPALKTGNGKLDGAISKVAKLLEQGQYENALLEIEKASSLARKSGDESNVDNAIVSYYKAYARYLKVVDLSDLTSLDNGLNELDKIASLNPKHLEIWKAKSILSLDIQIAGIAIYLQSEETREQAVKYMKNVVLLANLELITPSNPSPVCEVIDSIVKDAETKQSELGNEEKLPDQDKEKIGNLKKAINENIIWGIEMGNFIFKGDPELNTVSIDCAINIFYVRGRLFYGQRIPLPGDVVPLPIAPGVLVQMTQTKFGVAIPVTFNKTSGGNLQVTFLVLKKKIEDLRGFGSSMLLHVLGETKSGEPMFITNLLKGK